MIDGAKSLGRSCLPPCRPKGADGGVDTPEWLVLWQVEVGPEVIDQPRMSHKGLSRRCNDGADPVIGKGLGEQGLPHHASGSRYQQPHLRPSIHDTVVALPSLRLFGVDSQWPGQVPHDQLKQASQRAETRRSRTRTDQDPPHTALPAPLVINPDIGEAGGLKLPLRERAAPRDKGLWTQPETRRPMMSAEELLQAIAAARRETEGYLARETAASWHDALQTMVGMIDAVEARIRRSGLPLTAQPETIPIGVYAVRNLDELDGGALSLTLCRLHNAIKVCGG